MNIISPADMTYLIDDFEWTPNPILRIGEIVGCGLFKIVVDNAIGKIAPFEKTLFIQGCQDCIGRFDSVARNVLFWGDLFMDEFKGYNELNPFHKIRITSKAIRQDVISKWGLVVIIDAHLIPTNALKAIENNCGCKIIELFDPFDVDGEIYMGIPTITDTLNRLSPLTAYARWLYNVDSRLIDNKLKGTIKRVKRIPKRAIGKLDEKQYISNNYELIESVRDKQIKSGFRKNHKIICADRKINLSIDSLNGNELAFPKDAMGTVVSVPRAQLSTIRIYNTKKEYYCRLTYNEMDDDSIYVKPANIISTTEAAHHRFNHACIVVDNVIKLREMYSVIKNSNDVTVSVM